MSLTRRLLLLALLLDLLTVGVVQVAMYIAQQEWFRRQQNAFLEPSLVSFLERAWSSDLGTERTDDAAQVRLLLRNTVLRAFYDDLVFCSGRPPFAGLVFLNPRGAVHRDPDRFPQAAIEAGMARTRDVDGLVPAAGGFCFAIRHGDDVACYLWFVPKGAPPPPRALPAWLSVLAGLGGFVLFGFALAWTVRRTLSRPLQQIGGAAARVGGGDYSVRLPQLGVGELDALVASFNAMAAKIEGHAQDLGRAVAAAVAQAEERQRALVVSSRLAAVGTLAAGIAHEINNPIGGMQNAVARLLQAEGLTDKQRQYLQLVQDGLQRVARTARKVLDFSPKQVAARAFPLALAIDGARALVDHRLLRQQVQWVGEVPATLPPVFGDPHELQQVVLNLLLNALDALESKGRGGTIAVRASAGDGRVHLLVEDDGPGMAAADLGRVMDPFFSKKDRPDASGLGMFICYSIIRNHGGTIELDSAPGQGFRVRIALPAAHGGTPGASVAPA